MLRAATDQFANATLDDATSEAADEVDGGDAEAMEQDADAAAAPLEQAAPAVRRVGGGDDGDDDGDGGFGGGGDIGSAPVDVDGMTSGASAPQQAAPSGADSSAGERGAGGPAAGVHTYTHTGRRGRRG